MLALLLIRGFYVNDTYSQVLMKIQLPEGNGDPIREEFLPGPVDRMGGLVVIAPARRAGDPGSIPGPGENFFSLLLITYRCFSFVYGNVFQVLQLLVELQLLFMIINKMKI